ncbi:MAG: exonuclease SbcCD subunit D [Actinomycetota bacterium]
MKFLHTADWHVGKSIRGHSRADEHRAVLTEIIGVAADHEVELVVVAGDQFDTATPTAESERIVYHALLGLAEIAPVIVVSGNHDNARRLDAVARLLALGRVTMATQPRPPDDGGVVRLTTEGGTPVAAALLPFVSQRAIVRADQLMAEPAFRNAQTYAERMSAVIRSLTGGFDADSVNLLVAHAYVAGGAVGGGERAAHLVDEYAIGAVDVPATVTYAALGHLHRPQAISARTAIHYSGSPLQLDFGEERQTKQVNIVTAEPGLPAKVEAVPLRSGRPLVTVTGTVADLAALADGGELTTADGAEAAWIRARVTESPRAGLADEVRAALGDGVVDVRVEHEATSTTRRTSRRDGRTPQQLFADYLDERSVEDPRLTAAFGALHDELWSPAEESQPADPIELATAAVASAATATATAEATEAEPAADGAATPGSAVVEDAEPEPEPEPVIDMTAAPEPVLLGPEFGPEPEPAVQDAGAVEPEPVVEPEPQPAMQDAVAEPEADEDPSSEGAAGAEQLSIGL